MRARDAIEWTALGAIWGGAFLFTRVAVPEFGPFPLVAVRLLVAAVVLGVWMFVRGGLAACRARWRTLLVLGVVNSAVPFTLFAWAMLPRVAADGTPQSVSAGDASVMNGTAALFAAVIGVGFLRERLSVRRMTGLGVGFVGVVALVWDKLSFAGNLWAVLACLTAACLYGVASHIITRRLKGVPPVAVSAGSLFFAGVVLLPAAALTLPPSPPGGGAWMAAGTLGVLCTAVAFLMYFRLLRTIGPTPTMTVVYAIPAFGLLWGAVFLGEVVTASTVVGGLVIVGGVVMVQWPERKRPEEPTASPQQVASRSVQPPAPLPAGERSPR
jgi:drug/metabolite transporter (DMT)-like permease